MPGSYIDASVRIVFGQHVLLDKARNDARLQHIVCESRSSLEELITYLIHCKYLSCRRKLVKEESYCKSKSSSDNPQCRLRPWGFTILRDFRICQQHSMYLLRRILLSILDKVGITSRQTEVYQPTKVVSLISSARRREQVILRSRSTWNSKSTIHAYYLRG